MAGYEQRFATNADGDWVCAAEGAVIDMPTMKLTHNHGGKRWTQRLAFADGEIVCRGCSAFMAERESDQAVIMTHRVDCPEVSGAPAGQA